jgi:hypothetical protein
MRAAGTFVWAVLTGLLLVPPPALGDQPAEEETALVRCVRLCSQTPCTLMEFEGFSKDSKRFGHSYLACPGAHGEGEAQLTWHVREISPGKRKLHFKGVTDIGQKMPRYFKTEGYELLPVAGTADGRNRYRFLLPRGMTVDIELATEDKVAWYLTVSSASSSEPAPREIFRHRGEFEEIYFGLTPRVYLSPDGQKIAVLLALDAMVRVDAGLAVFSLNP